MNAFHQAPKHNNCNTFHNDTLFKLPTEKSYVENQILILTDFIS